jgi:hypothetical protein
MNYYVEKNKSKALENFVIYQKRRKESNVFIIEGHLAGLSATKGFIYEALGNSKFSKNPIKIPDGYKK